MHTEEFVSGGYTMVVDDGFRKAFGKRLKRLRKQKKLTQKELAAEIGVGFSHLNKYEGGIHLPPTDKILQLAEILNVTVDFLLTGDQEDRTPLHNVRLLERFKALQEFDQDDQNAIIKILDSMIFKKRIESVMDPVDQVAGSR